MEPPPPSPPLPRLPNTADLTPQHLAFLDQHFRTKRDLSRESSNLPLSSSLWQQCSELESRLLQYLTKRTISWISRSFSARSSLQQLSLALQSLSLCTSPRMKKISIYVFFSIVVYSFFKKKKCFWMFCFVFRGDWFEEVSVGVEWGDSSIGQRNEPNWVSSVLSWWVNLESLWVYVCFSLRYFIFIFRFIFWWIQLVSLTHCGL